MKFITIGLIIIMNLVSIGILYKSLGKLEIKNKLIITIVSLIIMYLLIFVIYSISSVNADKGIVKASRQIILFTFLPINTMCIMSTIATQMRKLKDKEIDEEKFKKKVALYAIIGVIILIIEISYIKDIQAGIARFGPKG